MMQARQGKRNRLRMLALGSGLAAVVAVAMIVLGSAASSSAADPSPAHSILAGIQQRGLTLGDPTAPVEVVEFADLTCPICRQAEEQVVPGVIRTEVATGMAKLVFRNFEVMGPEAVMAGAAAIAAGEQGHGWDFIEHFLSRQQQADSGYVDTKFLGSVAVAAGVVDLARWRAARNSAKVKAEVKATTEEATRLGLMGAPTFAVRGPRTHGLKILGAPRTAAALEKAIAAAG